MGQAQRLQHIDRPLEGLTVLVVEDNPDGAELLRQMTTTAGARALVARNGLEGLRVFRAQHSDVVLADLRMPGMDGFEMIAEIRRSESRQIRTPVIAVTAYGSDSDRLRTWSADFDAHIVKPVDYEILMATIQRVMVPGRRIERRRSPRGRPGRGSSPFPRATN